MITRVGCPTPRRSKNSAGGALGGFYSHALFGIQFVQMALHGEGPGGKRPSSSVLIEPMRVYVVSYVDFQATPGHQPQNEAFALCLI